MELICHRANRRDNYCYKERSKFGIKKFFGMLGYVRHYCYILHSDDNAIVITGKCIRVNQIPLGDMLHNAESLQSVLDYKPMRCYSIISNIVPLTQPDELEKLTIFGNRIAADDPDMIIMHEQLTDFPYKLVPEAMQNIRKIMQSASKEEIAMDSLLEDPFAPIKTYQSIMT